MAEEIKNAFDFWQRDYVTDGVPATGINPPRKIDGRTTGEVVQDQFDGLGDRVDILEDTFEVGYHDVDSVALATTANITLSGEQTIDGTLTSASSVLVKNQSAATGNGIYTTGAGAWTRRTDADTGLEIYKARVYVTGGSANAGKTFVNSNATQPTIGADNITFSQTGGSTIANGAVTNAKLADMAAGTIKGRASGAGTGAPTDLTSAQVRTIAAVSDNQVKGSNIASASSIDLAASTGDFVDVTGTTTITAVASATAGVRRRVRFTGALTLTHNATSLILPSGANIVTAAGDTAEFISLGSGNWIVSAYQRASGQPLNYNDATVTLTNKTINADNNTITNLETDNFKVNVIDADTALAANSDTRLPTQKAVRAYFNSLYLGSGLARVGVTNGDAMIYAGADGRTPLVEDGRGVVWNNTELVRGHPSLVDNLSYDQVQFEDTDPKTMAPATARQLTWSQLGDFSSPVQITDELIRVRMTHDRHYKTGAAQRRRHLESAAGRCIILIVYGQSNGLGTTGNLAGPTIPQTILTPVASRPGIIQCFNGGITPKQIQQHGSTISTPIDAGQYTSFIDAYEGINPNAVSAKVKESGSMALALSYASNFDFSGGGKIILINYCMGSAGLDQITDFVGTDSQAKIDLMAMIEAADTLATGEGLVAEIGGIYWNGHEGEESDPIIGALNGAAKGTAFAAEMASLLTTPQPRGVPVLWLQQDYTYNNGSSGSTGITIPWAYGIEQYARARTDPYTGILPAHWVEASNDPSLGSYPTVHRHYVAHYLLGSAAGHALYDLGRGNYMHSHLASVTRASGSRTVVATPYDRSLFDNYLITNTTIEGYTYSDSVGAVTLKSARWNPDDGKLYLELAADASGSQEVLRSGYNNATLYDAIIPTPSFDSYGRGASNGPRCTARAIAPWKFCPVYGRPLWRFHALQQLDVTVS